MIQLSDYLRAVGVPVDHRETAIGTPTPTEAMQAAQALFEDPKGKTAVLWGQRGAGKTVAAAWWLANVGRYVKADDTPEAWLWLRDRAMFAKAYELARLNLKFDREDRAHLDRLKSVRWLALDDLGAEEATTATQAIVEEIVDHRCANALWTVITTNVVCGPNLDTSPFALRYGLRTVDRIVSRGKFIGCGAGNIRRGRAS